MNSNYINQNLILTSDPAISVKLKYPRKDEKENLWKKFKRGKISKTNKIF